MNNFPLCVPLRDQKVTNDKGGMGTMVEPLTRICKKTGKPYVRPQVIEDEIAAALEWPLTETFRLAAAGRLRPQTIVYFLQRFRPNRSNPPYDSALLAFFGRLEREGNRYLAGRSELQQELLHGAVKDRVIEWMQDDRMDFFEASFRLTAKRLYLTAIVAGRSREDAEVPREDLIEEGSGATGEEAADALGFLHQGPDVPAAEVAATLRDALADLTEKERLAVLYVEYMGLKEKEAASRLGCSSRNVRYLVSSARRKIARRLGDEGANLKREKVAER